MEIAGVEVTAVELLDGRVRACFITRGARGGEMTWLEITTPVDAFPVRLFERLEQARWRIPSDALVVAEQATELEMDRDETGRVAAWTMRDCGYQQAVFPLTVNDSETGERAPTTEEVKEARNALRHFGINRAPNVTQTWRDVV